jgi:hypothetical protein
MLDLHIEARSLIQDVTARYDDHYGFGSMSGAVYDTAWVSLVTKPVDGKLVWLFPECFDYILRSQLDDGSWGAPASQVDGILNTAAGLLSLIRHLEDPLQLQPLISSDVLDVQVAKATLALQSQLEHWEVSASTHVGFEIIVPALLEQLEKYAIFEFPGRDELIQLNYTKMSRLQPEVLYGKHSSTAIHSLEAFVGYIDFDRVSHHKIGGSMMASPSSTAAYLINASTWDEEAEEYLRHVVQMATDLDDGVPSAYPSTYFELTWVSCIGNTRIAFS